MKRLTANTLPSNVQTPSYDRSAVVTGIVHFGVGNFHRAHQAVYIDDLLSRGDMRWGIVGVSLRSASMRDKLAPQDFLYTLAVLGEATTHRIIGALRDVLVAPEQPQDVIDLFAASTTHLISATITEKGYGLKSAAVDFDNSNLKAEGESLDNPKTIYGFIARGIIARSQNSSVSKLTVMCCDNISEGGALLKAGVEHLLRAHNPQALKWANEHVSFISTMVDRVSPATDDDLRDSVAKHIKRRDEAPVSAEPFSQWIVEDNFAGARPDFDQVGADFANNIAPFERMKLGYLNAAHTIASTVGYLHGDIYVHESLERPQILSFMTQALLRNVLPFAAVPDGYDGAAYIEDVIKRFQNANLPYANLQVGTDSSQKIQQRWFPTLEKIAANNRRADYFEFSLAAWTIFIQTALEGGVLNDPKRDEFGRVDPENVEHMCAAYLRIANADQYAFSRDADFMTSVTTYAKAIRAQGISGALSDFLKT